MQASLPNNVVPWIIYSKKKNMSIVNDEIRDFQYLSNLNEHMYIYICVGRYTRHMFTYTYMYTYSIMYRNIMTNALKSDIQFRWMKIASTRRSLKLCELCKYKKSTLNRFQNSLENILLNLYCVHWDAKYWYFNDSLLLICSLRAVLRDYY